MTTLGNDHALAEIASYGSRPPDLPFNMSDPAAELHRYLSAPNPQIVEGVGLEGTCRWWHPALESFNAHSDDPDRPWWDTYAVHKHYFRIHRFMFFMSDPRFASWRGETVGAVTSAMGDHGKLTGTQVRHLCPVSDEANPDPRERVKLCVNPDHLRLGTPGDNAKDGRWVDPARVMAGVLEKRRRKSEAEARAAKLVKTRPAECLSLLALAHRHGIKKLDAFAEKAARECGLDAMTVKAVVKNPPPPPCGFPDFQQEALL